MARRKFTPGEWGQVSARMVDDSTWQARAWFVDADGHGRAVRRRGHSRSAAVSNLMADLRESALRIAQGSSEVGLSRRRGHQLAAVTVHHLCEVHLAQVAMMDGIRVLQKHNINRATRANEHRLVTNKIMLSPLARVVASQVTVEHVADFYLAIAMRAPSEARNALIELKKVFDTAWQKGLVSSNPARDFRGVLPRRRAKKYVPGPLELHDFYRIAQAYRTRPDRFGPEPSRNLEDVIEVILGTSARLGEALGLHWAHIQLESDMPTVGIFGTVQERGGPKFYQGYTKTEAGERTIPIPNFLVKTLRRRARENKKGSQFVFHTQSGRVSGQQDIQRAVRVVRAWSKTTDEYPTISDKMVPHALRRSVATAISNGDSLLAAAKTLGHRETGVTENSYAQRAAMAPDMRHVLDGLALWSIDAQPDVGA